MTGAQALFHGYMWAVGAVFAVAIVALFVSLIAAWRRRRPGDRLAWLIAGFIQRWRTHG